MPRRLAWRRPSPTRLTASSQWRGFAGRGGCARQPRRADRLDRRGGRKRPRHRSTTAPALRGHEPRRRWHPPHGPRRQGSAQPGCEVGARQSASGAGVSRPPAGGRDRRAKLIFPTQRGLVPLEDAGDRFAEIEQHWAQIAGSKRFDAACRTMQDLLDALTGRDAVGLEAHE